MKLKPNQSAILLDLPPSPLSEWERAGVRGEEEGY